MVQQYRAAALLLTLFPVLICFLFEYRSQLQAVSLEHRHWMQGPETIALTGVMGPFLSAVLMQVPTYSANVSAVNDLIDHCQGRVLNSCKIC